jgi:hypothetical protein
MYLLITLHRPQYRRQPVIASSLSKQNPSVALRWAQVVSLSSQSDWTGGGVTCGPKMHAYTIVIVLFYHYKTKQNPNVRNSIAVHISTNDTPIRKM